MAELELFFCVYKAQCLPTTWRRNAVNLAMTSLSPYLYIIAACCDYHQKVIETIFALKLWFICNVCS